MAVTALLAGGAFGLKHAVEADHVAAVATLAEAESRPAATGAAWGVGHSVPILALGGLFLALGWRLPDAVATGFDALVGVVLVALGVRVLAGREPLGTGVVRHVHGETGGGSHRHLSVAGRELGLGHTHAEEESFAVGIVHGLAGSGGVVVALVAASSTGVAGAAFLAGFAVASVATMGVLAAGWARIAHHAVALCALAGLASVGVGAILLVEVIGLAG